MYSIMSRNKTNGSYTKCAIMDRENKIYGNKVEDIRFDDLKEAIHFICKKGDKSKIYYICGQYNRATDNDMLDAGNGWFVRQRYCYHDGWKRICLTTSKPYAS